MKKLLLFILSFTALIGCKPDFDPSDDFKEVDVVYGVINPDAVKNYFSVGRGFQTDGESALDLAKLADSIYHQDSLVIELIELDGSKEVLSTTLRKETFYNRDEGIFINPEHHVYATDSNDFPIGLNKNYKFRVYNTITGKTSIAELKTLKTYRVLDVFNGGLNLNFYKKEEIQDQVIKLSNDNGSEAVYGVNLVLPYLTKDKDNNLVSSDTLIFKVTNGKFADGGNASEFTVNGESFINKILNEIPSVADNTYKREFGIITVESICYSKEMYEYLLAEQSFNSLSQSKPFYSNVINQETDIAEAGLVASSKEENTVVFLSNQTIQYISSEKPSLGFPQ